MNPDFNKILFFVTIFVACFFPLAGFSEDSFEFRVEKKIKSNLHLKDGVIVWLDRSTGKKTVWGNEKLLAKRFLPGSLMKLVTAEIALEQKQEWKYRCEGHDEIDGKKRYCWNYRGHGKLDVPRALALSCNLFWGWVGSHLQLEDVIARLEEYGFQASSALKNSPEKIDRFRLAIGDSALFRVTPLEMLSFWDRFLTRTQGEKYSALRQGLMRTAQEGTASKNDLSSFQILAKTGTADSLQKSYKTEGWFLAAYPISQPRFALLIFLRNSHGYREPLSLASEVLQIAKQRHLLK